MVTHPDQNDEVARQSWRTTLASHGISLGVHALILLLIAAYLAFESSREIQPPADLDVIEYVEQAAGPVGERDSEYGLEVEPTVVPENTAELEEIQQTDAPAVAIDMPDVERPVDETVEDDSAERQEQLNTTQRGLDKLNSNVAGSDSGGGDHGRDPQSRGAQQARWTISYEWRRDCLEFGWMLRAIGMMEIGIVRGEMIVYVDPVSGQVREGAIDDEERFHWVTGRDSRTSACEREMIRRAGYEASQVIWFMDIDREPVLQQLEAEFARKRGMDVADIRHTVFTPYNGSEGWELRVQSMR